MVDLWIPEQEFLREFASNSRQIMWLLGAGASRSAGMPTATDIIWELKRRLYCLRENQDLQSHDLHNTAVRGRIQRFMDSKGFPASGTPEEYGFYFEENFGGDHSAQQIYLSDALAPDKISLSIGHRALAALLRSGHTKVVFTTNFDAVVETAYAQVTGDNLSPFHLEGAYAALDALNSERFPIVAKLHGDFRFRSLKNLPSDLLANEREIEKCFLAAADRYGIAIAGYSGRDESVMRMLTDALTQGNPFPRGVYWTVVRASDASAAACEFIAAAQELGLTAHLVETGPFDDMMTRIWKQIPDRPVQYEEQVRSAAQPVKIPLPDPGGTYPILRTNALPILSTPSCCGLVETGVTLTQHDLIDRIHRNPPNGIFVRTDNVLFWGSVEAAKELLADADVTAIRSHDLSDIEPLLARSGLTKSFFDRAIAKALCWDRPLLLRRRAGIFHLVVSPEAADAHLFQPIAGALSGRSGQSVELVGPVPSLTGANWAEALSIRLAVWNGRLWLMVEPSIWVEPSSMREQATPFLRQRRSHRYNAQSYALLDAWIAAIIGEVGGGQEVEVSCFAETDYPASFTVSTRTAYSRRGGRDE